jgi:hypothetical protein
MSKLNIGVGEEFPLGDAPKPSADQHVCAQQWRYRRHRRGMHAAGALIVIPAAAASVTAAIIYPLATLGVIGGLGLAAAAHRRRRWARYREAYRKYRDSQSKTNDTHEPPKENA